MSAAAWVPSCPDLPGSGADGRPRSPWWWPCSPSWRGSPRSPIGTRGLRVDPTRPKGKQMTAPSRSQFEFLQSIDTPTVCNLVEIVAPERRGFGYTVKHLHCPFPELAPIVGFAKTVTFKAKDAVPLGEAGYMQKRLDYLDFFSGAPQPSIMGVEDLDGEHVGYGAFWGEVQSNVHKALGCLGVVTNGSIRDIPAIAPGF